MSGMAALRCFLREALVGLWRSRGINAMAVGIIAAALAIVGGFLLLSENARVLADEWNRVQVIAYLKDNAVERKAAEVAALVERLEARPRVGEVRLVSSEEAMRIFRSRFPDLRDAAGALGSNPLPASLEISARGERGERREETERLLADLRASPLVDLVQDNEEEAQRLTSILAIVFTVGLGVGGVLAAAAVFIIFNVIRLTVHARRDEIAIMRLVGATAGFIRGPYLTEGMLQGGLGAAMALAALYAAHLGLADYAARSGNALAAILSARFLPFASALALAAGGLLIGLAGSALSLRRFLAD